jgi:inorganic pyrophosphatase
MSFSGQFSQWRPHPWHGLEPGPNAPAVVYAYIEITPFDFVKYEIDKITGYLRVDRPQRYSSQPPSLYGFIPRTFCGSRVSLLSPRSQRGDGDPMDICVLSERMINRSEVIVPAKVLGGIQMIDGEEADDKIIAVLASDTILAQAEDIRDLPSAVLDRLEHYFATYKTMHDERSSVTIESIYGCDQAKQVILASLQDYADEFGEQRRP